MSENLDNQADEKLPKGMKRGVSSPNLTLKKRNYVYTIVEKLEGIIDFDIEVVGMQVNEAVGKEPLLVVSMKVKERR